jgi:uncharacterized protein
MRTLPNERLTSDRRAVAFRGARRASGAASSPGKARRARCWCVWRSRPTGWCCPMLRPAPGRGAWIGVSRAALETALADGKLKAALMRAFKGAPLTIPDDLPARVEAALARPWRTAGAGMRSGNIVLGSDRIAEQARSGRVAALLHASDAARTGGASSIRHGGSGSEEGSGLPGRLATGPHGAVCGIGPRQRRPPGADPCRRQRHWIACQAIARLCIFRGTGGRAISE